jgi:hypothetical protein
MSAAALPVPTSSTLASCNASESRIGLLEKCTEERWYAFLACLSPLMHCRVGEILGGTFLHLPPTDGVGLSGKTWA